MESQFLKYSTLYAEKGWHCFPVGEDKKPLVKWGEAATTDLETLQSWAALYPNAGIGVACGPSKLVVLDVDVKSGGLASLETLKREIPEIENTIKARTGSGGLHYYFTCPEGVMIRNSASKIAPGLDIRGDGGFVVVPPSRNENGEYRWLNRGVDIPAVPAALLQQIEPVKPAVVGVEIPDGLIPPHTRHSLFLSVAGAMRARGATSEAILNALRTMNAQQCIPPHDDADIVRIAQDYGKKQVLPEVASQIIPKRRKDLTVVSYDQIQARDLQWLWDGRIPLGQMTIIAGVGGKGKSYATVGIAAAISTGQILPGDTQNILVQPAEVLMFTFEDDQGAVIKKRLDKCGANLKNVFTIPTDSEPFTNEDYEALERLLDQRPGIKLVIIDPLNSILRGVNENSDVEVRFALQPLVDIAKKRNIAVLCVKHLNKAADGPMETRVGGSVAFYALPRSVLIAGKDSERPPENGKSYHGLVSIKTNLGRTPDPILYSIDDHGLTWLGTDPDLTYERLNPKPKGSAPQ